MKKTVFGFTLIELMITVAIISILAAVAIPAYTQFIKKSRRSDAKIALMGLAQAQATHYTDYRQYADKIGDSTDSNTIRCKTFCSEIKSGGKGLSPDKHYTLSIPQGSTSGYTLTATAVGTQKDNDPDCKTLTLDSLNNRDSTPGDAEECWGKN